jgi:hypothetical protein
LFRGTAVGNIPISWYPWRARVALAETLIMKNVRESVISNTWILLIVNCRLSFFFVSPSAREESVVPSVKSPCRRIFHTLRNSMGSRESRFKKLQTLSHRSSPQALVSPSRELSTRRQSCVLQSSVFAYGCGLFDESREGP